MTDAELADEIESGELVVLALTVPHEIKEQIIAALRRLAQYQSKHTAIMQEADRRYDELATANALAQTEIKGHMRMEDELKVDLRRTKADLACAEENFHVTNQAYVKVDAALTQAQARVAVLEKVIRESRMPHGLCKIAGSCTACSAQQTLDGIALKSRA